MRRLGVLLLSSILLMAACDPMGDTPMAPDDSGKSGLDGVPSSTVMLPAGSVDALAAAIVAAGPNGRVLVAAGMHTESAGVVISIPVWISGEPGAILEVATTPDPLVISTESALFIRDTHHVRVEGLEIRAAGGAGNAGVTLFRAAHVTVADNTIRGHTTGINLIKSDYAVLRDNDIPQPPGYGIVVTSGSHARITGNTVDGAGFFGLWYCDRKGTAFGNVATNCFVGHILCKVPAGSWEVDGELYGSDIAGANWVVRDNVASDNLTVGLLVIDGANRNLVSNNTGSGNGTYDIEMTGDTYRFGFLTPKSFDNQLVIGPHPELVVKDCGENNSIIGEADIVDLTFDPCY